MTEAGEKLKVLYVAGSGRSGSTLLDVILGQVPGFFPVGEVRNVWDYGRVENRPCGCGEPVRACAHWSQVFDGELAGEDPAQVARWREQFAQTKRLLPMFAQGERYARREAVRPYLEATERLYHEIARVSGARVIVDSSKWPTYAFLLGNIPSIDLYVLHLVRDPRACAHSWKRLKQAEPGRYLDQQGPVFTTSYWVAWNPAIRWLFARRPDRYMFLRYEDFAAEPRTHVDSILRFADEAGAESPFLSKDTVAVSGTHAIEGNAAKFVRGELSIREDTEWRTAMPWGRKAVVTAMTWPFLWQYGYLGARSPAK